LSHETFAASFEQEEMKKRKLKFGVKKKARKKDGQGCIPGVTVDAKVIAFGMARNF